MVIISLLFDIVVFGFLVPTVFITISRALDKVLMFSRFDSIFSKAIGIFIVCVGFTLMSWSYYLLVSIGRGYTIELFGKAFLPVTKRLVKTGPYSKIRHPMALGLLIVLLGIGVIVGSCSAIFIALPFLFVATGLYLIAFEEKGLRDRFKDEHEEYRLNTNLIIPWFKKRR